MRERSTSEPVLGGMPSTGESDSGAAPQGDALTAFTRYAPGLESRPTPPPLPSPPPLPVRRASSRWGLLGAGLAGFLVGAVVWHFVGFWGFVREVVLKGPAVERTVVAQTGPDCTALLFDRSDRSIRKATCPLNAAWLTEGTGVEKSDSAAPRETVAKRWSVTVQAEADQIGEPGSD